MHYVCAVLFGHEFFFFFHPRFALSCLFPSVVVTLNTPCAIASQTIAPILRRISRAVKVHLMALHSESQSICARGNTVPLLYSKQSQLPNCNCVCTGVDYRRGPQLNSTETQPCLAFHAAGELKMKWDRIMTFGLNLFLKWEDSAQSVRLFLLGCNLFIAWIWIGLNKKKSIINNLIIIELYLNLHVNCIVL